MSMHNNQSLAERRKELGLTLDEVAKSVGVSKATVSRWESGEIDNMRRDRIAALAKALRVSPLTIMGIEPDPPPRAIPKADHDLLVAYHDASDEAKRMVHFALRDSWPSDDEALEYVPGKGLAKATKKAASKALAEGKTVVIPAKINNKPAKVPDGVKVTHAGQHLRLTPTMSYHCKAVFGSIQSEAYEDEDIKKALETYRETLLDKKVATFISDTMDTIEARYGPFDESRAYTIIAEEVMGDDFMERYVAFGGAGVEKLIKRIRNRFR
ncbi:helix-turn-helix domain-containing protein [Selenomonas ruminantium]|uniref:helix-turn-helix domain-containing protein n=1 Tax=Selenomonas ruminantium TaxID=971 RepID=UPI0026EA9A09|nr:helix-turn-helix transcriptional regulator [Selenomonas ruminantium]